MQGVTIMSDKRSSTAQSVLNALTQFAEPVKTRQLVEALHASGLDITKKMVNSVLYGELSDTSLVDQDADFCWRVIRPSSGDTLPIAEEQEIQTPEEVGDDTEPETADVTRERPAAARRITTTPEESRAARRIIRTLRSGTTSRQAARAITVGTSKIERELFSATDLLLGDGTTSELVVISADWGFGKSHMRMLLSSHLSETGVPFIHECIDARAASLAHIHRSIPRWLDRIQFGKIRGLRDALLCNHIPTEKAGEWASTDYSDFAFGLRWALNGNEWGWLRAMGHLYRSPDYPYQHPKARRLFDSVARFLKEVGFGGLVLLLDEAENINQQYDIRGRRKSYDMLARFICHPNILPIMFITERLIYQVAEDYERGHGEGWYNWTPEAKAFVTSFLEIEPVKPPVLTGQLAEKLVANMESLYSTAYSAETPGFSSESVLDHWRQTPTRSIRLLVRLTINELDLASHNGYSH